MSDTNFIPPAREDVQRWYANLDERQRKIVGRWLDFNPPPETWTETALAYAYTEMPAVLLVVA